MLDPGEVWRYEAAKTAAPEALFSEASVAISDAVSDCDRNHLRVR